MNFGGGGAPENNAPARVSSQNILENLDKKGLPAISSHPEALAEGSEKRRKGFFRLRLQNDEKRKCPAFTMAEVLITLGILGVVIAMTLPGVIEGYKEKELVTRFKRDYTILANAYLMVLEENGSPQGWYVESWDDVAKMFLPYLQKAKFCENGEQLKCFAHEQYKDLTNNRVNNMETNGILLNDGSIVGIGHQTGIEDALQCKNLNYCFHFVVDLNGVKPPNRWGVDTFTLVATDKKLIPRGGPRTHANSRMCDPTHSTTTAGWWNGSGCGAWVLMKENMDYLKCVKGNQKYCNQKYYFN